MKTRCILKILSTIVLIQNAIYLNSQTCPVSFSPAVNYTLGASVNGIVSADFNNDGHKDLAVNSSSILVLLGSAQGTFGAVSFFGTGAGSNDLIAGDINADGKQDLMVANFSGNNISVLIGTGTGSFNAAINYTAASGPRHLALADFNNDLKLDLVVSATNVASVTVLFGDGAGTFTSTSTFAVGSGPQGVIAADFNNDTHKDIITANQADNSISLLLGNGAGSFSPAVPFAISGSPRKLTFGDYNGDNNLDVATAHFSSPQVSVLLGTGTGSFSPFNTYISGVGAVCYGITSADLNNDGAIDLATPNNALSTAGVLLGSGTGTFAMGVGFGVQNVPLGICYDDFNKDGKIDLAVANSGSAQSISVLLNTTDLPLVSVATTESLLCAGQTATLTASGANAYSWNTTSTNSSIAVSPVITTTYSVVGTATNACKSSITFTQNVSACTGVLNFSDVSEKKIECYPNPFNSKFFILSENENEQIGIYNLEGKKVHSLNLGRGKTEVDFNLKNSGVYFIRSVNGSLSKKIIKE